MYKYEDEEYYDSCFSSDLKDMGKQIHLAILNSYNFNRILDFGCGKGVFTHMLKKRNNYLLGLDVSEMAIMKARSNYGHIVDFDTIKNDNFETVINNEKFNLTIILETFSYIKNWKNVIEDISRFSDYIYIALDIPENPIGFVKSFESLKNHLYKYFTMVEELRYDSNFYNSQSIFILTKNLTLEE
jgi:predicted TPR repeat methyltransferase